MAGGAAKWIALLWNAPVDTPAFRSGAFKTSQLVTADAGIEEEAEVVIPDSSHYSRPAAARIAAALEAVRVTIDENADELGRIDAIAGDGDHGIGMRRGSRAAAQVAASVADKGAGAQMLLWRAADAWSDRAGGTSGALWRVILRTVGDSLADTGAATATSVSAGTTAANAAVMGYGKATVGDKTMVDSLVPSAETLAERVARDEGLVKAWSAATAAAKSAADQTTDLMPGTGGARSHGEKALGVPDPGAVSLVMIAEAIGTVLADAHGKRMEHHGNKE